MTACPLDLLAQGAAPVAAEVVELDRAPRGHDREHESRDSRPIGRARYGVAGADAVLTTGGEHRDIGTPVPGDPVDDTLASRCPPVATRHCRNRARLVQEDRGGWVEGRLNLSPLAGTGHFVPFPGNYGLFCA